MGLFKSIPLSRLILFFGFGIFAWMQCFRLPYSLWTTFAFVICTITYIFLQPTTERRFYVRPAALGFIALYLLRVAGAFATPNQGDAWLLVGRDIPFVIFPLVLSFVRLEKEHFDAFLRFMVWAMGAVLLAGALWLLVLFFSKGVAFTDYLSHTKKYWGGEMPRPFFWQPSYVLLSLSPLLPACLYLKYKTQKGFPLWAATLIYLSFLTASLLSGSRVNIVLPIVFIALAAWLSIRVHWVYKVITILALGFALVSVYENSAVLKRKLHDVPRSQLWSVAVESITEAPWFGKGTGASSEIIHYADHLSIYARGLHHFHNQYLEELVQFGCIGSLVSLLFLYLFASEVWKRKDLFLGGIFLILLLFMVIEAPFNSIKGIYFTVFWLNVPLLVRKS